MAHVTHYTSCMLLIIIPIYDSALELSIRSLQSKSIDIYFSHSYYLSVVSQLAYLKGYEAY